MCPGPTKWVEICRANREVVSKLMFTNSNRIDRKWLMVKWRKKKKTIFSNWVVVVLYEEKEREREKKFNLSHFSEHKVTQNYNV